jgi:UrcA family protein
MYTTRTRPLPFALRARAGAAAVCSAIVLGSAIAMPAAASDDAPRIVLRAASLKPDGPAAAERLYAHIRSAARRVCSDHDGRSLRQWQDYRACVSTAVAQAVADVDSDALAAAHRLATGGPARHVVTAAQAPRSSAT